MGLFLLPLGICALALFLVATGLFSRPLVAVRVEICCLLYSPLDYLPIPEIIFLFNLSLFKIIVLFFFFSARGDTVFARTSSTLQNPDLKRLASSLPTRSLQSWAPCTTDQYSMSFQKFRVWASCFPEITALPTRPLDVALYLEHLIESDTSSSVFHHASCGISWANKLYGFPDTCQDPLIKNILEAGVRISAKPVVRKEPVIPEMISSICSKRASPSANLASLRIAALFITAYCAFLRFDEPAKLRCCDVNFYNLDYVKIIIASSKTDVYRDGSSVLLARSGTVTCPYTIQFSLFSSRCFELQF